MDVQGCIPPMVTPVDEATSGINTEVLRDHTEFLIDGGVTGLFPCGSTGEFSSLTRQERKTVIETVADVADDVPVLAGCGDTSLKRIDRMIEDAARVGADAAVVVTPYYLETTQESLVRFFRTIADNADIPIILYEIPSLTGTEFTIDTVVRLADHDNVVGLKASVNDALRYFEFIRRTPGSFDVLTGLPELTLPVLGMGGSGVIAGPANVYPNAVSQIVEAATTGSHRRATELMNRVVLPILSAIRSMPTVPALKHLMSLRGVDIGPPLQPMPELDDEQRGTLEEVLGVVEGTTP